MKPKKRIILSKKSLDSLENIKSDFITVASHQLRTPISAVRWSLDTLLSDRAGALSEKQREVVQEAYQNNKFMVKVVNDLLRVSRLEEKGINLSPEFVNVLKMSREVVKMHQDLAKSYNCQIILNSDILLPLAYVDPIQIKLVLEALIDNAILYGQGKALVKISFKKIKDYLVILVQDNGIGIPADQQNMVFTKFFRGRNAMKVQTGGLGLDLYLAKKTIESSGGKIDFTSKENSGTIFKVLLPLTKDKFEKTITDKLKELPDEPETALKKEREFVSVTVHELKAPLGITRWSLEMLKSQKPGKLNKEQLELIEQIYRGNERLLVLVRDLLNLAKLQQGNFDIDLKPTLIEPIISDAINSFNLEAKRKNIKLQLVKPFYAWPTVMADNNRTIQVLTNLLSNAIKYTPPKGKVIMSAKKMSGSKLRSLSDNSKTISINNTNNKKGYLVIMVQDTGMGISSEDQRKLFTRFFRSKNVLKSKTEGTGLGLYIAKSIVNLHHGDIWFTSQLNAGSIFYFSLPIA